MRGRLDRLDEESAPPQRERSTVRPVDSFLAHGLNDDQLGSLRAILAAQPDCGMVWLVRKELRYQAHRPLFVLCVRRGSARWWSRHDDRDRELIRRLTHHMELPGQVLIFARSGSFRSLAAWVMSGPDAAVFRRDGSASARSHTRPLGRTVSPPVERDDCVHD
jgi:hypothetical protein